MNLNTRRLKHLFAELKAGELTERQFDTLLTGHSCLVGQGFLDDREARIVWSKHRRTILNVCSIMAPDRLPYAALRFDLHGDLKDGHILATAARISFTPEEIANLTTSPIFDEDQSTDILPIFDRLARAENIVRHLEPLAVLQMVRELTGAAVFFAHRKRPELSAKVLANARAIAYVLKRDQEARSAGMSAVLQQRRTCSDSRQSRA